MLEKLAHHWRLIQKSKYEHRRQSYGTYDCDIVMIPHNSSDHGKVAGPILSPKTLISSSLKPFAINKQGQKVSVAGKEYF